MNSRLELEEFYNYRLPTDSDALPAAARLTHRQGAVVHAA
jgi:hypothetical protein